MLEHTPLSGDVVHFSLTYFRPNQATLVDLLLVPRKVAQTWLGCSGSKKKTSPPRLLTLAAARCPTGASRSNTGEEDHPGT